MKNAKISRRSFLLGLAACSAAGILTACKGADTPASSASTSPEAPASSVSELEPIGLFSAGRVSQAGRQHGLHPADGTDDGRYHRH